MATFKKEERLYLREDITTTLKKGRRFSLYPFKVTYHILEKQDNPTAIMISVPKKQVKSAVKRNLLKRRIRESYRLNKESLSLPENKISHIIIRYIESSIYPYSFIEKKIKAILNKISHEQKD